MSELQTELEELLSDFRDRWCRLKPTELRDLWDPDEANPFYIAEEVPDPMYGWDVIEPYWQAAEELLLKFSIRTQDLKSKQLSDSHVVMNFIMHWNGLIKGMEEAPLGLDVRVSAVVKRTTKGWRFCHYVESPLGAFPYLKATYAANVDPGFMDN
ncbi:MAG: nuclear transport factor 2 family protein [Rhodospirillaceae bacterium]|nr:nuclear transport factor 2 family protein [Rhodospirillaceae bacterium]